MLCKLSYLHFSLLPKKLGKAQLGSFGVFDQTGRSLFSSSLEYCAFIFDFWWFLSCSNWYCIKMWVNGSQNVHYGLWATNVNFSTLKSFGKRFQRSNIVAVTMLYHLYPITELRGTPCSWAKDTQEALFWKATFLAACRKIHFGLEAKDDITPKICTQMQEQLNGNSAGKNREWEESSNKACFTIESISQKSEYL